MPETVSLKDLLHEHTMASDPALARQEEEHDVRCLACGHRCLVKPGRAGVCRVRFNADGQLRVPGGYVAGLQIDPIEKKPFYHAFPGRDALSFGMLGCDLHCSYCQNWVTSQALRDEKAVAFPRFCSAEQLIDVAVEHAVPVIVSTYNEPLITADWAMTVFRLARQRNIVCGFVSNGNATPEVLEYIRPCVDLYKVDLKSFNDRSYRQLGCTLDNVLRSVRLLEQMDFWVEIVTLTVPGFNDSDDELKQIADFLVGVSEDIPWHITAFRPDYKMIDPQATPAETLIRGYEIGKAAGLRYVYPGNAHGQVGDRENTYCTSCGGLLIKRLGFTVLKNRMRGDACPDCGAAVPGRFEKAAPARSTGAGFPRPLQLQRSR